MPLVMKYPNREWQGDVTQEVSFLWRAENIFQNTYCFPPPLYVLKKYTVGAAAIQRGVWGAGGRDAVAGRAGRTLLQSHVGHNSGGQGEKSHSPQN